jgi:hypothetical protein
LEVFSVHKIFLRPFTLMLTEPILLFTALYLALAYALMYLMFQAYPIVFQGKCFLRICSVTHADDLEEFYGLSPSMAGVAYVPSK